MAVSDLLFTVVVIPRAISVVFSHTSTTWYLDGMAGNISCKLCYFIQDVCTAVSVLTLVAIAVDRYYAIVFPMRSAVITPTVRKVLVACIWIIAMGFHSPYFYAFRLSSVPSSRLPVCIYVWGWDTVIGKTYFLISSGFLFILPLLIMSVIYSVILISIRRRKIPGNAGSSGLRRHKVRRNRKVLIMVLAVLLAFLLCWLPFNIYGYLLFFELYVPPPCSNRLATMIILCIAYANAAVNPFIYFALSENYRIAAVHIIKCRSKRQLALRRENTSLLARHSASFAMSMTRKRTLRERNVELSDLNTDRNGQSCI
ncbi:hypothetical protein QZH41_004478 [Actinostola sp. cb2023]|nr:hypothetical protein QZH41_004478 [Actinostola sp. cb2023]